MPAPAASDDATRAQAALGPWGRADGDSTGWALLLWLDAMLGTGQLQDVEDWARDDDYGPGWAKWMDPQEVPIEALGWLGQFVGVQLLVGLSDADQRNRVQNTTGFTRGSIPALSGVVTPLLTGTKRVDITERLGGNAYAIQVMTYSAETANSAAVLLALMGWKPGGLILTYIVSVGPTIDELVGTIDAQAEATIDAYAAEVPV